MKKVKVVVIGVVLVALVLVAYMVGFNRIDNTDSVEFTDMNFEGFIESENTEGLQETFDLSKVGITTGHSCRIASISEVSITEGTTNIPVYFQVLMLNGDTETEVYVDIEDELGNEVVSGLEVFGTNLVKLEGLIIEETLSKGDYIMTIGSLGLNTRVSLTVE